MSTSRARATSPRGRAASILLVLGSVAVLAATQVALLRRFEPVATISYDLSWWSYILLVDSTLHLKTGSSPLRSRPRAFLLLALWSGAFWLAYEVLNFRLQNWYYVGVPGDLLTRTVGAYVSFATVLPGVLETTELLAAFDVFAGARSRPFALDARRSRALTAVGFAFLVLPLAFPRQAYALIWGAAFLLLEPWLAARDENGLLARLSRGDPRPILRACLAGAACGLLWEWWNSLSPARWIYTVPFFEEGKLFEMPWLGFVGFVPFALCCESFARALVAARRTPDWRASEGPRAPPDVARVAIGLLVALSFSAFAIAGVSSFTIRGTTPWVDEIPGLPASVADDLARSGIQSADDLVDRADQGRLPTHVDARWLDAARLMTVRGLGARGAAWLAGAGVADVGALARADPEELLRRMLVARAGPAPLPIPAEVRVWVRGARTRQGPAR